MDDEWWNYDSDDARYRQGQDYEARAKAAAERATWWAFAVVWGVVAGIAFATPDAQGNARGLGANVFIALLCGPMAALFIVGVFLESPIHSRVRKRIQPRPLDVFAPPTITPTRSTPAPSSAAIRQEERYGARHQAERAKYADTIRRYGGQCMEDPCIMPSRRIEPGAFWHLAHDHKRGGPNDYRGPAHPECNEEEARARGVTWDEPDGSQVASGSWAPSNTVDHDPWMPPQADNDPWAHPRADEPPF